MTRPVGRVAAPLPVRNEDFLDTGLDGSVETSPLFKEFWGLQQNGLLLPLNQDSSLLGTRPPAAHKEEEMREIPTLPTPGCGALRGRRLCSAQPPRWKTSGQTPSVPPGLQHPANPRQTPSKPPANPRPHCRRAPAAGRLTALVCLPKLAARD